MKLTKLTLSTLAASLMLCTFSPTTILAAPDAAQVIGDVLVDGIHFSADGSVVRKLSDLTSPWGVSNLDIYFNQLGGKVGIGGQPTNPAVLQVFNPTATGQAALFQISNSSNPLPAVYGLTSGSGQAIFGLNIGVGRAGHFRIFNSGSSASALVAETNGTGYAGEFLGKLKVTDSIIFADASTLTTAKTDCMGGRYEDNGDGTVSDCRTGLIWLKNASCRESSGGIVNSVGFLDWVDAGIWTAGLGNSICGLTDRSSAGDWRLPTKTELMAMVASAKKQGFINPVLTNRAGTAKWTAGDPFDNVQTTNQSWYLSNTHSSPTQVTGLWILTMGDGITEILSELGHYLVWPVRSGQ